MLMFRCRCRWQMFSLPMVITLPAFEGWRLSCTCIIRGSIRWVLLHGKIDLQCDHLRFIFLCNKVEFQISCFECESKSELRHLDLRSIFPCSKTQKADTLACTFYLELSAQMCFFEGNGRDAICTNSWEVKSLSGREVVSRKAKGATRAAVACCRTVLFRWRLIPSLPVSRPKPAALKPLS